MNTPSTRGWQALIANQTKQDWAAYLLVAGLMATLSVGFIQFAHRFYPNWNLTFLPPVCFLISLQAAYSRAYLHHNLIDWNTREGFTYRAAEVIVWLAVLRLLVYAARGFNSLSADILRWRADWLTFFDDGEYLLVIIAVAFCWVAAHLFAADIHALHSRAAEILWDDLSKMEGSRTEARRALLNRIFGLGSLLALLAAFTRIELRALFGETGPASVSTANLVTYFALALTLVSYSQFAMLRGRWLWMRLPVSDAIPRRWLGSAAIFLTLLAIIAFLLPTRYTLGLLQTLRYGFNAINFLLQGIYFIALTLFSLLLAPLFLLLGLFLGKSPEETGFTPPPTTPFQEAAPAGTPLTTIPWLDLLQSLLFWTVFLGILGLAIVQYLRQNRQLLGKIQQIPLLRWIFTLFSKLFEGWWHTQATLLPRVRANLERLLRPPEKIPGLTGARLNPLRLPAREQILFHYRALLRRAAENGLPRPPAQTPSQYAQSLHPQLPPENQPDLQTLTEQYLQARYTRHEIAPQQANLARQLWNRLRLALKRK
ncbi:MAG: hypothetical protein OHK0052_11550 [Anaerolineales bacterium]